MDQQVHGQSQGSGQLSYPRNTYEAQQMMRNPSQGSVLISAPAGLSTVQTTGTQLAGPQVSYQQMQQMREQELRQQLKTFWANQIKDIKKITEFKNHSLPLARIKKIMKADEDVKMISAEAPIVFSKACEMFILDLTLRAWYNTEENKRRTLQRNDVTATIARTDIFDFLVDIIPKQDVKDEPLFSMARNAVPVAAVAASQTYYHVPTQQSAHPRTPGENMNRPVMDPNLFRSHVPYAAPMLWYPQAPQQPQSSSDS